MYDVCYYSSAADYGGAEVYLECLMEGVKKSGLNVVIILDNRNKKLINKLEKKSIDYEAINMSQPLYKRYFTIYKLIKTIKPDLFHVNLPGPWNGCFMPLIAKLSGVKKVITTEHLPMFGPSIKYTPIKLIDNYCTDKTVTVSYENVKYLKELHKINEQKIAVVHNGIDVDKFNPDRLKADKSICKCEFGFRDHDIVVGVVGRLTEQKGHVYAFEATKLLKEAGIELNVALFGGGEKEAEYIKIVKNLGIEDNVRFLGFQSDMNKVYSSIDILLMPSLFEALPLTLIEAMASGVPAIASEINGIPEVIDNDINGILVEPKNVQQIKEVLKVLIDDKTKINQLGDEARKKIIKCFSLEKMVSETKAVY